jgi:hypothetical protein
MCRNIRMLFNFEPPATEEEMRAAALQYVRKVSGTSAKPSKANQARFDQAVEAVARATRELLDGMETHAPSKSREEEAARAKARSAKRFGRAPV